MTREGTNQDLFAGAEISNWLLYEKIVNWALPGLQFFYRDTNSPIDVRAVYHVGQVLRAGFFVDMTTKLLRPIHRTRFLIASAHAAMLCRIDELCQANPDMRRWGLCTLHYNSYLKVMDVYEQEGYTQVFLLHIPETAARLFRNSPLDVNFTNKGLGGGETLVDMARRSLNEKLAMEVHPRSMDDGFVSRMYDPIGIDVHNHFFPMKRVDKAPTEQIENLGRFIHQLADDKDIELSIREMASIPYDGVKGRVCEDCIYTNGIPNNGRGCGRLFPQSFLMRYTAGMCEYKKVELFIPSDFEKWWSK